jgi:[ribosomal protein S5]-alanine N-acetyltransferase
MSPEILVLPATATLLEAALHAPDRFGRLLGAEVADGWTVFPETLAGALDLCATEGYREEWGTFLFLVAAPRTVVGIGGYRGPPAEGVVEIGYALAPAFRGRGLATAAARTLVERAFADPRVHAVVAHTLAVASPSTRVLEKLGMVRRGGHVDPADGEVWRWELARR